MCEVEQHCKAGHSASWLDAGASVSVVTVVYSTSAKLRPNLMFAHRVLRLLNRSAVVRQHTSCHITGEALLQKASAIVQELQGAADGAREQHTVESWLERHVAARNGSASSSRSSSSAGSNSSDSSDNGASELGKHSSSCNSTASNGVPTRSPAQDAAATGEGDPALQPKRSRSGPLASLGAGASKLLRLQRARSSGSISSGSASMHSAPVVVTGAMPGHVQRPLSHAGRLEQQREHWQEGKVRELQQQGLQQEGQQQQQQQQQEQEYDHQQPVQLNHQRQSSWSTELYSSQDPYDGLPLPTAAELAEQLDEFSGSAQAVHRVLYLAMACSILVAAAEEAGQILHDTQAPAYTSTGRTETTGSGQAPACDALDNSTHHSSALGTVPEQQNSSSSASASVSSRAASTATAMQRMQISEAVAEGAWADGVLVGLVLQRLVPLAADPVTDVRLALARLLADVAGCGGAGSLMLQRAPLRKCIKRLRKDASATVAALACGV